MHFKCTWIRSNTQYFVFGFFVYNDLDLEIAELALDQLFLLK